MKSPLNMFAERAHEKASSRASDYEAIASGAKSAEQVNAENGAFSFPRARIRIDFSKAKRKY